MKSFEVTFRWGREEKRTTLKEGHRVLAAGYLLGYDEVGFGECGGSCVCSTCHVRVKRGNFAPMKQQERDLLDTLPTVYADSRLACQLYLDERSGDADTGGVDVEWMG